MYASRNIFLVRFYKNSMLLKEVDTFSTQGMNMTSKVSKTPVTSDIPKRYNGTEVG